MKKDAPINISESVECFVDAIFEWYQTSIDYCRENYAPEHVDYYIEKGLNIVEVYEAIGELINGIEFDHEKLVDEAYPKRIRTYKEWSDRIRAYSWSVSEEELAKNTSQEEYKRQVFNYIKFLFDFCVKYNICILLTEDQQKCLTMLNK